MESGRDGASRTRPLVAVVVAMAVVGIVAVSIGGSSAMGTENSAEWSPNPGKEVTPDNRTTDSNRTTDGADEVEETNDTAEIDVPACRVNETDRSSEPNETTVTFGDDGTTSDDTTSNDASVPVGTNGSAGVVFADQNTTGTSVVVESATVPDGGFVVIHDASLLREGAVEESVIGVSEKLDAQQHEDVEVTLARALNENKQLVAVLYRDTDGDGEFRFGDDPYRDDGNSAVADDAYVSVLGESERPPATNGTDGGLEACPPTENDTDADTDTTADADSDGPPADSDPFDGLEANMPAQVVFDDQESNGTAVTVESATVPEGGFVVIHDASLLQGEVEGSVVGVSERLDSGMHENVTVALDEPLTTEQPLIAVVYRGGDPPDPYTNENGTAVADDALVSVLGGEGNDSSVTNPSATPNTSEPSVTDAPATTTPADGPFAGTETATTTATRTAVETTSPAEPFAETETQTGVQTTTAAGATTADAPSNAQTTSTAGRDEQTAGNAGEEETTQTEAPGFGVVSALAALLSLALFIVRRQ